MGAQQKNIVGPQVRQLRVAVGMSQSDLVAFCQRFGLDIDRSTIAKIKGLMRWVGDFELAYLMKVLKCDFADLIADA
jgi:hypothetical protein